MSRFRIYRIGYDLREFLLFSWNRCKLASHKSMQTLNLKPTHAPLKAYYEALGKYGQLNFDHEMAVRSAFQHLLEKCANQFHWTLIAEYPISRPRAAPLKVDGALLDEFRLKRGLWEAKDEHDDLEKEAKRKIAAGYPTDNIIFQAPEHAILYQNGVRQALNEDISSPASLPPKTFWPSKMRFLTMSGDSVGTLNRT